MSTDEASGWFRLIVLRQFGMRALALIHVWGPVVVSFLITYRGLSTRVIARVCLAVWRGENLREATRGAMLDDTTIKAIVTFAKKIQSILA